MLERECDHLVRNDRVTWGSCMVACGDADAMVTGGTRHHAATIEKLNNIAWPIIQKSSAICGSNVKNTIGLEIISLSQIDKKFKKAASEKLNFTENSQILFVIIAILSPTRLYCKL